MGEFDYKGVDGFMSENMIIYVYFQTVKVIK